MEFFRNPKINFIGSMKGAFIVSMVLVITCVVSLLIHGGPRMSIDFTGGSVLQVRISPVPEVGDIRAALEGRGYEGVQVTEFGATDEFLITFLDMLCDYFNEQYRITYSLKVLVVRCHHLTPL